MGGALQFRRNRRTTMTSNMMPDLTGDEIKKYGIEVLKAFQQLEDGQRRELFALIGFCSLLADFALLDRRFDRRT
jgi:hypothetical protein